MSELHELAIRMRIRRLIGEAATHAKALSGDMAGVPQRVRELVSQDIARVLAEEIRGALDPSDLAHIRYFMTQLALALEGIDDDKELANDSGDG